MLLSQRIAKNPGFLNVNIKKLVNQGLRNQIRMDLIASTKFLIDNYGIDERTNADQATMRVAIFGSADEERKRKHMRIWQKFARPSLPVMTLDAGSFCVVVKEISVKPEAITWEATYITGSGAILSHKARVILEKDREEPRFQWVPSSPELRAYFDLVKDDSYEEVARKAIMDNMLNSVQTAKVLTWLVCETLTFLNCKNVVRHHYVPKKSENADLPPVLLPKFTYHVLDVFRERKEYVSLEDVTTHLWAPRVTRQTRAHLVMGHFKNIRGTLFWWNAHMRNKKNAETVGMVHKDYQIHNQQTA